MRNKRILVTGGAGFIGSNLVRQLVLDGNSIIVLDNFISGYKTNLSPYSEVQIIEGDVRDPGAVEKAMKGVDVVFHLAASVGNKRSIDNPLADASVNVLGTIQVLETACKFGVQKIVASSSAGIFGELKTIPIKEDHPVEPDSPYGCTKLCEEKLCLSYAKLYDLEAICLRYFNVYGPNQRFDAYGNVIPIFVFHSLQMEPLIIYGDGEPTRWFGHVRDVVQANIKAGGNGGLSGRFNIASGKSITINQLVAIISKANKGEIKVEHRPERKGDVRHSLANISLAHQKIGYAPSVDLESGIHDYIEWARGTLLKIK